jgi:integrase/recombinase XerD
MSYRSSGLGSVLSSSDSPTFFRDLNRRKCIPPVPVLPETIPQTRGGRFLRAYEKKAKALRRALNRVADWELPGKDQAAEYLRDLHRRNCMPTTMQGVLFAIYIFLTCLKSSGKKSLSEISKEDLEHFIEHEQDRGIMISTVRTKQRYANMFLRYLITEGVIGAEVLARRIRLRQPEPLPRAMDPEDVQQMLSVIDQPRDRALVLVLLRTGMRIGELLDTRLADVHLNDQKIDIYEGEKNRLGRVVYLSEDAVRALKHWWEIRDPQKDFLFYARGKPSMSYSKARSLFEQILQKAGLSHQGYTLHALRHTFASELLNAGMRIECLQPLLGHRSLDVTRRYARLTDKTREAEYFRAMAIIERGDLDGHYRLDHSLSALLETEELLSQYREELPQRA